MQRAARAFVLFRIAPIPKLGLGGRKFARHLVAALREARDLGPQRAGFGDRLRRCRSGAFAAFSLQRKRPGKPIGVTGRIRRRQTRFFLNLLLDLRLQPRQRVTKLL